MEPCEFGEVRKTYSLFKCLLGSPGILLQPAVTSMKMAKSKDSCQDEDGNSCGIPTLLL